MTAGLAQVEFEFVRALLLRRASIEIDESKRYLVETRLTALARDTGIGDALALVNRVRSEPAGKLADRLIESMTTNETSFFRDLHPFEAVRTVILPRLVAERREEVRVWSAACSTGQEAYSLAIVLREGLPAGMRWSVTGTDINSQVVARAAEATYSQLEVNRGLPAATLVRHFRQSPQLKWTPSPEIRLNCSFRQLNLGASWPTMGPFDIVFLRNALIYLDAATRRLIFERLRRVLTPNGHLFLGTGETPTEGTFERATVGRSVCYRLPGARN